jgi:hypothetical protein
VLLELFRLDPGDDAVEALPVEIDDPERIAEASRERFRQGLPDVALVELGVAQQRDEAPSGRDAVAGPQKCIGQRGEERRRRTEPDGTRREIDRERVLRPARIALQAPEVPEPGQVFDVEAPE